MPGRKREADSEEDEERFESAEDSEEDVRLRSLVHPRRVRYGARD